MYFLPLFLPTAFFCKERYIPWAIPSDILPRKKRREEKREENHTHQSKSGVKAQKAKPAISKNSSSYFSHCAISESKRLFSTPPVFSPLSSLSLSTAIQCSLCLHPWDKGEEGGGERCLFPPKKVFPLGLPECFHGCGILNVPLLWWWVFQKASLSPLPAMRDFFLL